MTVETLGLIVSRISSLVFWAVVLITLVRICIGGGVSIAFVEKLWEKAKQIAKPVFSESFTEICNVFIFGLAVRLFIFTIGFFLLIENSPTIESLFHSFRGWDSAFYIDIAALGYEENLYVYGEIRNVRLVFFPLYAFLIRLLNPMFGDYWNTAYVVSMLAFNFGLCYMYKLVKRDFGKSVAWWSIVFLSFAPPAFFFGTPMTESLMILTSAASLYYLRTHKWALAGLFGALCMLTRMVGFILIVVALVEFITHYKIFGLVQKREWKQIFNFVFTKGIFIALIPVGGLIYLYINWQVSGDPFRFMYYQSAVWHNTTQYFGQTIIDQFNIIARDSGSQVARQIHIPNVLAFMISIVLLAYALKKNIHYTYVVYSLGYTFVSFAPSWLLSGARYMVACVPLFVFMGNYAEKKPLHGTIILIVSFMGMITLLRIFLSGGFIL